MVASEVDDSLSSRPGGSLRTSGQALGAETARLHSNRVRGIAAMEAGEPVEFEIGHGYMLRSDVPGTPDFFKTRLENMVNPERALAERQRKSDETT